MESEQRKKLKRDIGYRFMTARKGGNFTQQEIANRLGVSRTTVTNWEAGTRAPEVEDLVEVSFILGKTPNYFLGVNETDNDKDNTTTLFVGDSAEKLMAQDKATQAAAMDSIESILQVCDDTIKVSLIRAAVNAIVGIDTTAIINAVLEQTEKRSIADDERFPEDIRKQIALKQEEILEIVRDAGFEEGIARAEINIKSDLEDLYDEYLDAIEDGERECMREHELLGQDDSP